MNLKEILRYLGYGQNAPDEETVELIKECYAELMTVAVCKHTATKVKVEHKGDGELLLGDYRINSKKLEINLENCKEAFIFAATLGSGTDMLMNKYVKLNIAKAAVVQACGAAMIEDYIDICEKELLAGLLKEQGLRPRFSPGFGDFTLEYQMVFMEMLKLNKTLGIHLTDGGIMIPEKSVTAIIGITEG